MRCDVEGGGCDPMPDACGNDQRSEKLIERQERAQWGDPDFSFSNLISRERNLLIACVCIGILLNFDTGRYVLYPFQIFSTWVHEMCHGLAAIIVGGSIAKLQIFKDGSGLAYTATGGGSFRSGFVSSAGYPGTAFTGCFMLLFRRTTLGPTIMTIGIGIMMILSCCLWVRNDFGLLCLSIEGAVLVILGWVLPATWLDPLFSFLGATCCLNAVESIKVLFSYNQMVNGEEMRSDAHSVASSWGGNYKFWSMFWFVQAIVLTIVGVLFARNARQLGGAGTSGISYGGGGRNGLSWAQVH